MPQIPSGAPSGALPPASAQYETAMNAGPGKAPQLHKWSMFRSSQGETHLDFGKTGVIGKPGAQQAILLDHEKREARIVPAPVAATPAPPSPPPAPGGGAPPASPAQLSMPHVKDLGTQMIGGHEAEGKLYTFQPPKAPAAPGAPGLPGLAGPKPATTPPPLGSPQAPSMQPPSMGKPTMPGKPPIPGLAPPAAGAPAAGQPPAPPGAPAQAQTLEVWTHTKLKVPVLTKTQGMPGLQTSVCKDAKGGEPPASKFQIPPGYKLIEPKPPALPRRGV